MEIRHYSELEKMLAGTHPIRRDAPEVLLLERLCAGDAEGVCALFPDWSRLSITKAEAEKVNVRPE